MTVRAKMRCSAEKTNRWSLQPEAVQRVYEFQAVYEPDLAEDQRYAKATPNASLSITVDNPNVWFKPGVAYYLDFTEAE